MPDDRWGYFKVPGNFADSDTDEGVCPSQLEQREPEGPERRLVPTGDHHSPGVGRPPHLGRCGVPQFAGHPLRRRQRADRRREESRQDPVSRRRGGYHGLLPPGRRSTSSPLLVFAEPMAGVMLDYSDSAAPKAIAKKKAPAGGRNANRNAVLSNRGLCGDVYLIGTPAAARIADVKIGTSFRKGEITVDAALQGLKADARYALRARILDNGKTIKEFTGKPFGAADLKEGRMAVVEKWKADKLWDIHTPQNTYHLECVAVGRGRQGTGCRPSRALRLP